MRSLITVLLMGVAWMGSAAADSPNHDSPYLLGITPQFDQRKLFTTWKPVLEALEKRTGLSFKFASTASLPEFEQAVASGTYDFVYVNPYQLYKERDRQGYVPLVRDVTPLRGIVVVRKDSPIRNLKDLNGRSLAVPSPNAMGASLLVRAELERQHGVKMSLINAKSHTSAYLHVINRLADAGGGVEKTLAEQSDEFRSELRTVFTTREFPSHPVAGHPRVPEKQREAVRQAWLDISATPEGRLLLKDIPMSWAVPASFKDYQIFQALDLDAYWVEIKSAPSAGSKP